MEKHVYGMLSKDHTFGHWTAGLGLLHASVDYSLRFWIFRAGVEFSADAYIAVDVGIGPVRIEVRIDRPLD